MDKRLAILISSFSILTFTISLISSILIVNSENARTEKNGSEILSKEQSNRLLINFETNNELELINLTPGYNLSTNFTIINNSREKIRYNIKWIKVNSSFKNIDNPESFIYSLNCSNGEKIEEKQMPLSIDEQSIYDNLEINPNEENKCSLFINFKNNEAVINPQYFKGTIKVDFS